MPDLIARIFTRRDAIARSLGRQLRAALPTLRATAFLAACVLAFVTVADVSGLRRHHGPLTTALTLVVTVIGAVPLYDVIRHRLARRNLRRRHDADACLRCGYDMRGNVTNACPECGRRFVPPRRLALRHTIEAALPLLKPPGQRYRAPRRRARQAN